MIIFDVIFWVDNSIIIGIIVSNDFNGDSFNISTTPSSVTFFTCVFSFVTIEISIRWTVFSSPLVFDHNHTFEDFSETEHVISVGITIVDHDV